MKERTFKLSQRWSWDVVLTVCVCVCAADLWVLPGAEGVHRVESEAAETRTAPSVGAEGHAGHPYHLQSWKPSSHHSAWHVHVLHRWPESGMFKLKTEMFYCCHMHLVLKRGMLMRVKSWCCYIVVSLLPHAAPPWSKDPALQSDDTEEPSWAREDQTQPRLQDMQELPGTIIILSPVELLFICCTASLSA